MSGTGELSKLFEIDRTTLNYYVKSGLIRPALSKNQYHQYGFSDSMALAFIRYYRGLDFSTEEITSLLNRDTNEEKIRRMNSKKTELMDQIRLLQTKLLLLENLEEDFAFICTHPEGAEGLSRIQTEPYFFIQKKEITDDPEWMELYRTIPSIEFSAYYDKVSQTLKVPDLFAHSGISIKESWLDLLCMKPPKGSIYYPSREISLLHFSLPVSGLEKTLSEKIRQVFSSCPDSESFSGKVIFYMFPSHYEEENSGFDCLCFLD